MSTSINFIVTFPIFKPFRRINTEFRDKLRKTFRPHSLLERITKRGDPNENLTVEELNQFMFFSLVTTDEQLFDIPNRISQEDKIDAIYDKFSRDTLKQLNKIYSKDPELQNSLKAFKQANKILELGLAEKIQQIEELPNHIIGQIDLIYKNGSLIIWDLPGGETDRIISGYEKINRENDSVLDIDIGFISDELALASFGRNHVPVLCDQVKRILEPIQRLPNDLANFRSNLDHFNTKEELEAVYEVASVLMGKLLGIREPINLAAKQLDRYLSLKEEIEEEGKSVGSTFLENIYEKFIDIEEIHDVMFGIKELMDILTTNSESIRLLLVEIEKGSISNDINRTVNGFVSYVSNLYVDLEEFRMITETFQDIPSFTAMSGDIAIESASSDTTEINPEVSIYLRDVFRTFPLINSTVYAVRGVDLEIKRGEFVSIMGPSGSGKTTLLNLMSGIDRPDRGIAIVEGTNLATAKEKELVKFRRDFTSFIFQSYNLLPILTNRENVSLPSDLGTDKDLGSISKRRTELLGKVGLEKFVKGRPNTLSGGQMQRVTIARALMNKPQIIFADEPTGDLDSATGMEIMDILVDLNDDGVTIVLVTHDKMVADRADRIVYMRDGKIVESP